MKTKHFFLFILLTIFFITGCGDKYNPDNASEARTMSEEYVKDKLSDPDKVEFANASQAKVIKIDGVWRINSYFFETTTLGRIRRSYRCLLTLDSVSQKWHLESLEFKQ